MAVVLLTFGQQFFLPRQRMAGDGVEVIVLRRPVERGADAGRIRDHGHDVAGPALGVLDREIAARGAAHGLDGFEY